MTGVQTCALPIYRLGHTHLTLDYYHLTPGLVEGERDEKTGELLVPDGYDLKGDRKSVV